MLQTVTILLCVIVNAVYTMNLPGPFVYVVTPKTAPSDSARSSAPFYYHNWMRRVDPPRNSTPSTTTTKTTETPDLIFAEFESDNGDSMRKSLRKLLEKERITKTTSTTIKPILVENVKDHDTETHEAPTEKPKDSSNEMEDYFAQYNKLYNPAPVFVPTTTQSTTEADLAVANVWRIIDDEKRNTWQELPVSTASDHGDSTKATDNEKDLHQKDQRLPLKGISTITGNGAENESRAIRTESKFRFPYVDLQTMQLKPPKKSISKESNTLMNLDDFQDVKLPVRGEAQDYMRPVRPQIDRYNPAQPHLPSEYGPKAKPTFAAPQAAPTKSVSNLVPPPPPPLPPQAEGDTLPAPSKYDSFPPYAPSAPSDDAPVVPPTRYEAPTDYDSDSPPIDADSGPPLGQGYRYKQPSPPKPLVFVPTAPPPNVPDKPLSGYAYKPPINYSPPADMGYTYNKPLMTDDSPPKPDNPPAMDDKPAFSGYHYSKPSPPKYGPAPSYGPGYHAAPDYPELIYDKPPGGMGDMDSMNAPDMGMGMKPPPPPPASADAPPADDHGFPHDFPGDFKFHDFDSDHDFHYHHHHPTTTTTTTTETPRVNRYSYYYLGKKLYYLPLYFSVYFIVYVGALIIKAVLRHKIVYPNSWRPNDTTASFFAKRSVDDWHLSGDKLHQVTTVVTNALATAAEKYMKSKNKDA